MVRATVIDLKSITSCHPPNTQPLDNQIKNKKYNVGYPALYPNQSRDLVKYLKNNTIKFLLKNIVVHHYSKTKFKIITTIVCIGIH
jgi:hypothetical protein